MSKPSNYIAFTITLTIISIISFATSYTSVSDGNWTNSAVWTPCGCPSVSDDVTFNHTITLNTSIGQPSLGSLIINTSGVIDYRWKRPVNHHENRRNNRYIRNNQH